MAAMRELLERPDRPTAVFAASDEMAMGAAHVARRAGVRVPQELSVIGIDDHEMAELYDLTTVAQPVAQQGVIAADLITAALEEPDRPQPAIVLPTHVVVRGSTGPPRT
jgi:LacI family transcriptional regulator, repressor for deo operon, udp, cdd, tsx, nupC, and nupG